MAVVLSTWFHVPWNRDLSSGNLEQTINVFIGGFLNLRKFMVHGTVLRGSTVAASNASGGLVPYVSYSVDWFPAGGDQRRIYTAYKSVTHAVAGYKPTGGLDDAIFGQFLGCDNELAFNQQCNYDATDRGGTSTVQLKFQVRSPLTSNPMFGEHSGIFSCLGQQFT